MIGSDGHGGTPLYARELQLHVDAGIPVWDVLRLSTSEGAQRLDLGHRTGRFEVGLDADLVFLRSNPLADITHVKEVDTVVTNGTPHTFAELTATVEQTNK
jgi:imidazolonepropionase-like amidohydrolase